MKSCIYNDLKKPLIEVNSVPLLEFLFLDFCVILGFEIDLRLLVLIPWGFLIKDIGSLNKAGCEVDGLDKASCEFCGLAEEANCEVCGLDETSCEIGCLAEKEVWNLAEEEARCEVGSLFEEEVSCEVGRLAEEEASCDTDGFEVGVLGAKYGWKKDDGLEADTSDDEAGGLQVDCIAEGGTDLGTESDLGGLDEGAALLEAIVKDGTDALHCFDILNRYLFFFVVWASDISFLAADFVIIDFFGASDFLFLGGGSVGQLSLVSFRFLYLEAAVFKFETKRLLTGL